MRATRRPSRSQRDTKGERGRKLKYTGEHARTTVAALIFRRGITLASILWWPLYLYSARISGWRIDPSYVLHPFHTLFLSFFYTGCRGTRFLILTFNSVNNLEMRYKNWYNCHISTYTNYIYNCLQLFSN